MPLELVVFLGLFPAVAALAGVALGQWLESRRDAKAHARTIEQVTVADRRAQRDAKLARMRAAFQPVLLAAWGMQTAGVGIRHSPKTSTPEARNELLDEATKGVNEARAQLMMESDVDLDRGIIRIRRTLLRTPDGLAFAEPKSAASRRAIPVGTATVTALRAHRQRQAEERLSDLVFSNTLGGPINAGEMLRAAFYPSYGAQACHASGSTT